MSESDESLENGGAADAAAQAGTGPVDAAEASGVKKAPAKKAPAKKAPAKKAPAKKAPAKKAATSQPKYPRHSVEKALRIPEAILLQNGGDFTSRKEAVSYIGATSLTGALNVEISSGNKYGFLESNNQEIRPSARARKALVPESDTDRLDALREAVLAAPDISDVYSHYRGESLPDEPFFANALTSRFGIPVDKVPEFKEIFLDSLSAAGLLDSDGDRVRILDIGRDDSNRSGAKSRAHSAGGQGGGATGTCFVMQPFAAPLGEYFEKIYRPAIDQTGLKAVRADDDIFGTGKIIDQIWRGINEARVLVAELTTKNPNVFYELGLAHAIQKPVILVSSNEDDVPFDLRHIRVVVYDTSDPFWGQKLIDNIADKIQSALNDPEEAIFQIEGSVISRTE